jgi:hypothetical protein
MIDSWRLNKERFMKRIIAGVLLASVGCFAACTAPAWVNTVVADAATAAPIAGSLIDVIDPPLAPLVTLIENGFTALVNTLNAYKAAPTATNLQAVQAAFQAVDGNVAQLESAAQVKNPATQTKVTAIVQLLSQVVTEIAAQVPASPGLGIRDSGRSSQPPALTAKGLTAKDFKKQFNAIVAGDPRFKPLK